MSRQVLEYGRKVAMEYWLEGGPKSETLDKNFWKKLGQNAELPAPQKGADPKTCYEAYCNVVRETYKSNTGSSVSGGEPAMDEVAVAGLLSRLGSLLSPKGSGKPGGTDEEHAGITSYLKAKGFASPATKTTSTLKRALPAKIEEEEEEEDDEEAELRARIEKKKKQKKQQRKAAPPPSTEEDDEVVVSDEEEPVPKPSKGKFDKVSAAKFKDLASKSKIAKIVSHAPTASGDTMFKVILANGTRVWAPKSAVSAEDAGKIIDYFTATA